MERANAHEVASIVIAPRLRKITPAQNALLEALRAAVKAGEPANFYHKRWKALAPTRTLPAEMVRALVLGDHAPSGVQILNAIIDGEIDLRNARGPDGGAANTLKLQGCTLAVKNPMTQPALDACHSHLSRLSLIDCKASGLHISSAVVDGDLILEGLRPLPSKTDCWVRARGIRVGGSIVASGAKLRSPRTCPASWKDNATRYAFDLYGAHIGGSLELRNRFTANGGLRLILATIGGDVRAEGALLQAVDHENASDKDRCLRTQGADIRGTVFLCAGPDHPFDAEGITDLSFTTILGAVMATGAHLRRRKPSAALAQSFLLDGSSVGAGVWMISDGESDNHENNDRRFETSDGLSFFGATLNGPLMVSATSSIDLRNTHVSGDLTIGDADDTTPIDAIWATGLKVGGDLELAATLAGVADYSGIVVQGNLRLGTSGRPLKLDVRRGHVRPEIRLYESRVGLGLQVNRIDIEHPLGVVRNQTAGPLTVFPGWRLAEASFTSKDESNVTRILSYLFRTDDPRQVVILDGSSEPIYDQATLGRPRLETPALAEEYLRFFCAHVWGEDGAFEILDRSSPLARMAQESADALPLDKRPPQIKSPKSVEDGSWAAVADVAYGDAVFRAEFRLKRSGKITMAEDWPLADLPEEWRWGTPETPFRKVDSTAKRLAGPPPLRPGAKWDRSRHHGADAALDHVRTRLQPEADLRGLRTATLDDRDGKNWPDGLTIDLDGFEYARTESLPPSRSDDQGSGTSPGDSDKRGPAISLPTSEIRAQVPRRDSRLRWLKERQYGSRVPGPDAYRPQPFEQLAKVWRSEGSYSEATDVTFERLCYECEVYDGWLGLRSEDRVRGRVITLVPLITMLIIGLALILAFGLDSANTWGSIYVIAFATSIAYTQRTSTLKKWFLQRPFGYGLRTERALGTFLVLWLIGAFLVWVGTRAGIDIIKVDASNVGTVYSGTAVVVPTEPRNGDAEIRCGDQIDPMLYALDVMVPLLDFRQEQRCTVSADAGYWFWRLLKVGYAVLGWIVVSGLVLTASGFVRRQIER